MADKEFCPAKRGDVVAVVKQVRYTALIAGMGGGYTRVRIGVVASVSRTGVVKAVQFQTQLLKPRDWDQVMTMPQSVGSGVSALVGQDYDSLNEAKDAVKAYKMEA